MRRLAWKNWIQCLACGLLATACATRTAVRAAPQEAEVLQAHRTWWQAFTTGDQATLAAHTAGNANFVFSSGTQLGKSSVLEQAGANRSSTGFTMDWSDETVRLAHPGLAIVSGTSTERAGTSTQKFRLTTVLDGVGGSDWKVLFVQSTRAAQFAPAVPPTVSGPLGDYTGNYATPRGRFLRMEVREGALWMIEPAGKAIKLNPIGPGLFEAEGLSPLNGVLRFLFARDQAGRVASFSRLVEGHVDTFPRER